MATMVSPMREHNAGSLFQRKSGRNKGVWIAAVTMRNGKRATRWSKSREEAKADLAELLRLRDAGAAQTGRVRLGDFLERWVSREHGWAPATLRKHESLVRVHLQPALGHIRLSELSPSDVDHAIKHLGPIGAQTRRHVRATLRRALADAQRDGLVTRNVGALSRAPGIPQRERPILDADQARLLIDSTRGTRFGALWTVLITTGMRISEALGLAWSDVDMGGNDGPSDSEGRAGRDRGSPSGYRSGSERQHMADVLVRLGRGGSEGPELARPSRERGHGGPSITVRHALQRVQGEWQLRPPKTAKGRRTIPLTPLGREALRAQRAMQLQDRFGWADATSDTGIGVSPRGSVTSPDERPAGAPDRATDSGEGPNRDMRARYAPGSVGSMVEGAGRRKPSEPVSRGLNNSPSLVAQQEPWRQRIDQEQHGLDRGDAPTADAPARIVPLDDSLVFTTSTGHPIHATNLLPKLRADLAAAGLPTNIGLHSLRHSSASILLRAGLPLPTISAILGHSTIRITADIYAHVMEESKVEAAEAMQRMLG